MIQQEQGAIVDVQDSKGNTALHLTCAGEQQQFASVAVVKKMALPVYEPNL